MNTRLRFLTLALLAVSAFSGPTRAADNTLTDAEKAGGWKPLFDGHSTSGWRNFKKATFPTKGWVVEDGCLKHTLKGGGGDIITDASFDDFELSFEWRLAPDGNSGVKYFITENRNSALGHEYQLVTANDPEASEQPTKHVTASFYDVLPTRMSIKLRPAGQFNESRILVRGNHVEHWLNGEKTLAYELGSAEVKAAVAKSKFKNLAGFGEKLRGHLLLQDHGGEVWFRNLKIRVPQS